MIHLLWPTIRPQQLTQNHQQWTQTATHPFTTTIALNTPHPLPKQFKTKITGDIQGVAYHAYQLTKNLNLPDNDIIILTSDDITPPPNWDNYLTKILYNKTQALHVNDGYIKQDSITIPIMTASCLKKLNNIIYHPSYKHTYADTELYHNLKELQLLNDQWNTSPIFEHKNWANQKRPLDKHDQHNIQTTPQDAQNWTNRQKLTIQQRLTT
jgi:hypothetical protein